MKSIRNAYDGMITFDNLMEAHRLSSKGRRRARSVMEFEQELNINLYRLKQELETRTYQTGKYRSFKIYEPKERLVTTVEYRDRVVHHLLCDNVLWPFFDKRLDDDNSACRKNKGTHYALGRASRHLKKAFNKWGREFYILKCDITKYFYNIRHDVLKKNLYRYISDKDLIVLLDKIIDSANHGVVDGKPVGLPIGNLTSQFFAVYYLDVFDKFVKCELKIPLYSRYMDDFLLIHNDKKYLTQCLARITEFLGGMGLTLNSKTQMFPAKNGVDYCGFHTYITNTGRIYRKLRRSTKARMKRKVRCFKRKWLAGEIKYAVISKCLASWTGHAGHGNTYRLVGRILKNLIIRPAGGGSAPAKP